MDKINQAYQRVCAAYQTHMALDEDAEPMTHGQWFGAGYQAGQADAALQPSAWVSCAERLPTEADQQVGVLVCQSHDRDVIAAHGLYGDCWVFDGGTLTLDDVSHWMPFPQPPEGV